jgi:vitamin B12 transporter
VLPLAFPLAITAAFSLHPAAAQTALKETVVTATRTPTRSDELVSEVVVIDRDTIEKSAGRTLPEILARQAGLEFSSNGGRGKASGVYIRGTEARHTLLLIDGVRYGSATVGTPIWDNIPLAAIERIEVGVRVAVTTVSLSAVWAAAGWSEKAAVMASGKASGSTARRAR